MSSEFAPWWEACTALLFLRMPVTCGERSWSNAQFLACSLTFSSECAIIQFCLINSVLFWPVLESNELYICFANWLCFWGWDCGHSSNWQLEQGHWKSTWFHHLLPVVSVTLYMNCDRWFLRLCVNLLCASRCVLPYLVLEGATAHKASSSTSRLLFLSWAAWQAELEMSHWLLGTSCSLMGVMSCSVFNSKKLQKFLKIAYKQSKSEIKINLSWNS